MKLSRNRWRCHDCDAISLESALLKAPNPFNPEDEIAGCPVCKSVEGFHDVCDEPGCSQDATSGWPSIDGYRRTCHNHSEKRT